LYVAGVKTCSPAIFLSMRAPFNLIKDVPVFPGVTTSPGTPGTAV
jgi:hypothetical protein